MKRDFDLVRLILKDMEEAQPMEVYDTFTFEGYDRPTIDEHIELLIEAGLLEGKVVRSSSRSAASVARLTWAGHDFLDASRDEGIWKMAKDRLIKPIGGVSFGVLLEWLKWQMKQKLGMPTE